MNPGSFLRVTLLCALLTAGMFSACRTMPPDIGAREDKLAAAGFLMKPANTPERHAMLSRLPAHRFVIRRNGDTIHYAYADPLVCDCLYVGTRQAYDQYRATQRAEHFADERQLAALTYADDGWSWSAWGPWGSPGPPFGFVYNPLGW